MVINGVRALLAEPRAPNPPRRVWRDCVLVGALVTTALLEGLLRDHVEWRPVAIVLAVGLAFTLLWRRTHPLASVAVVFGSLIVLSVAGLIVGSGSIGLNTMVYVVVLPYSLCRWGSGREIGIGMVLILIALGLGLAADYTGVVDSIAGSMFLLFPALLGGLVRGWTVSREREIEQVKSFEREQLARELHDTVAHHVSAIAIRAQAGRLLAGSDPEAAGDALAVIEEEASRTLDEMRAMVGDLRDGQSAQLTPQPSVADLGRLARNIGESPRIEVAVSGDVADLRPSVGTAIYRIAQESVTNAVRHARQATRIDVRVEADGDRICLTVHDDGQSASGMRGTVGYGLVGMTERATLLGGSLEAGPDPDSGWTVSAVLPKSGERP